MLFRLWSKMRIGQNVRICQAKIGHIVLARRKKLSALGLKFKKAMVGLEVYRDMEGKYEVCVFNLIVGDDVRGGCPVVFQSAYSEPQQFQVIFCRIEFLPDFYRFDIEDQNDCVVEGEDYNDCWGVEMFRFQPIYESHEE